MSALAYWEQEYQRNAQHHSSQNGQLARDLFGLVSGESGLGYVRLREALRSERIIEVGCGTGELTAMIAWAFRTKHLLGVDLSAVAIEAARRRYPFLDFEAFDVMADHDPGSRGISIPDGWDVRFVGPWQLAVCSNVLEHFADPHAVIDRIFTFADQLLAVVPYAQPVTDDYRAEGEAGHVFCFSEETFGRYSVVESVVFESVGWTWSSKGEQPLQLAVLVRPK